mgnify:CR=1 FL=1
MGKGVAFFSLLAGIVLCGIALGLVPLDIAELGAPRTVVLGGGALLTVIGFLSLARDHRGSDTLASLLLLLLAGFIGWLTFYAPAGTLHRFVPMIPPAVNDSLGRLLFGLGVVVCAGMAFLGLRRLIR